MFLNDPIFHLFQILTCILSHFMLHLLFLILLILLILFLINFLNFSLLFLLKISFIFLSFHLSVLLIIFLDFLFNFLIVFFIIHFHLKNPIVLYRLFCSLLYFSLNCTLLLNIHSFNLYVFQNIKFLFSYFLYLHYHLVMPFYNLFIFIYILFLRTRRVPGSPPSTPLPAVNYGVGGSHDSHFL